jgi:lysophospholipase L1-like esterase
LTYSFGVKAYCTTVGGFTGSAVFGQEVDECAVWSYLKYTTTFTPPTSPYVGNETNLVALYHLDDLTGTDSIVPTSVPAIVTAPAITSIDVNVGTIATASSGTWSNNPYSFTYQWNRGGTPIAGATASTHTLVAADVGSTLTCTVIATNAVGASSSSTSAATATITTPATLAIAPNNAAILYSPGNWLVSSSVAKSINPGAYFRTTFTGELCILNFDVTNLQYPPPMIKYRIDGYGPWTAVSLSQSSIQCVMPTDTTGYDYHLLEVEFKSMGQTVTRWASPQAGAVSFLGLTVSSSSTLVLPNSLPLTAMVFGDSITEGYHTINSTASDVLASDAQISWARQLGTQLSAEVGVVGFASQGLLVAGTGGVPVFISTVGNMWSGQARTFPTLDFLVIVQGTNDTTQDTTTAWTALINYLVPLLPNTTKIFVVQPFSTAATHNNQVPFITAGIAASSYPTRAVYIGGTFMDTTDSTDGLHPEGWSCSAKIAPRLSTALRKYITAPPPSFQNML